MLKFFRDLTLFSLSIFILTLLAEDLKPGFVTLWFDPKNIFYIFLPSLLVYLVLDLGDKL